MSFRDSIERCILRFKIAEHEPLLVKYFPEKFSKFQEISCVFLLLVSVSRCDKDSCYGYVKRRVPILSWLRDYKLTWLPQDALAGFTVGLTAIPQGIAYAIVADLSPEVNLSAPIAYINASTSFVYFTSFSLFPQYGLYATFMASFVYIVFGSCKSITIGPTAIMATMVRPLVSQYNADMVVLLSFLKGCMITLLGLLHLGESGL